MNFDHLEFPLDDVTAQGTIDTGRHPTYRGKWGLIVIRLKKDGKTPLSYWHEGGFEMGFDLGHAEYPLLFQTLKGAKARQTKMIDDPSPGYLDAPTEQASTQVVLTTWVHPDWDAGFPKHTKYSDIRGQFPGSPTQ